MTTDPKSPVRRPRRTLEQQRTDIETKIAAREAKNDVKKRKKIAALHAEMQTIDANGTSFTDEWIALEGMIEDWLAKPGAAS